ncbi:oligosaccharide flippase family protein [Bacillus sp. NEB1478]|uniref:oligosaccharide flippase family protein n=1 Tax=Bacillus sp. NEB1478 TaxID=3073816 RepID=UPI002873DA26|nr:oligosaccharide flippase family protein [Bacillus sp. NEB1478]WNB92506.1 oligosaccharide flippase family protein [Bacillus sp. NEB1478]
MFKNSIWSFINLIGNQSVFLITNVVLARLLNPEIFGILAISQVFTVLAQVFQESSVNSYLIYKNKINQNEIATAFWTNVFLTIFLSTLLFIISFPVSNIYNIELVEKTIKIISVGLFLGSFGITSKALFLKYKKIKEITIIEIIGEISSSIAAIIFAYHGSPLFAITSRLVIKPAICSILFLITSKSLIYFTKFNFDLFKNMIPYSSKILSSQTFIYFNNNIDYLLIGRMLGSKSLGLYTIAFQWSVLARYYISGSFNKIAFPEISNNKSNILKVKEIYINIVKAVSFISFPFCSGLIVIAHDFILVLYGSEWLQSVTVLKLLLLSGLITSISTIGGSVFNGLGKPQIEMWLNVFSFITLFIVIVITSKYGLIGISFGILFRTLIFDFIKLNLVNKLLLLNNLAFYKSFNKIIYSTCGMLIVLNIAKYFTLSMLPLLRLVLLILVGTLSYIIFSLVFNKEMSVQLIKFVKKPLKVKHI